MHCKIAPPVEPTIFTFEIIPWKKGGRIGAHVAAVFVKSRFAIGAAFKLPTEQLDQRFGISRRRCGVKVRVEGDAGQIITPGLQVVDEIVTGVIGLPTGARDSLAPLVLCWVEADVLILVGTVCVGARAKNTYIPSNLPEWPGIMSNRDLACTRWTTGFTAGGAQDVSRRRAGGAPFAVKASWGLPRFGFLTLSWGVAAPAAEGWKSRYSRSRPAWRVP